MPLTPRKPCGFPSDVTPRRATPADAQAIAEVHIASWQVAYRGFFPDSVLDNLSVERRRAQWDISLATVDSPIWVSESAQQVNGFIFLCPSRDADLPPPEFAELAALYVHPSAWGTGCGYALALAGLAHLRQTTAQSVIVWVLAGNMKARRFYERIGFVADGSQKDATMFNAALPEVRYRQSLR